MPYLARFTRSGHDFFIYGTEVPSFYRSFGRTLCGDPHVGRGRPPQDDEEEENAQDDGEKRGCRGRDWFKKSFPRVQFKHTGETKRFIEI